MTFAQTETLKAVFKHPTRGLSFRHISRISGLSTPVVSNAISQLENQGLVEVQPTGKALLVRGNVSDPQFQLRKRFYNHLSLLPLVDHLSRHYLLNCLVVFGSYSRGEDLEGSDIDLLVVGEQLKDNIDLSDFENALGRELQLFTFPKEIPKEMEYVKKTGVLLYGKYS